MRGTTRRMRIMRIPLRLARQLPKTVFLAFLLDRDPRPSFHRLTMSIMSCQTIAVLQRSCTFSILVKFSFAGRARQSKLAQWRGRSYSSYKFCLQVQERSRWFMLERQRGRTSPTFNPSTYTRIGPIGNVAYPHDLP